jgi:eukaryotic-like serine/threonine-protein kinase
MRGHHWLAPVAVFGLMAGQALAQPRVWTDPSSPNRELLDRLNLSLGWTAKIPMDGRRDGIVTIQSVGGQVIVQTAYGRVACLDGATGAARWITAVGEPYQVAYDVAYNDDLILVSNATRIFGLDRVDGVVRWDIDLPTTPSSPPVADNVSFFVNLSNGRLSSYLLPNAPNYITLIPVNRSGGSDTSAASKSTALPVNDPRSAARVGAPVGGSGRTVTVSTALDNRSATIAVKTTGGRTVVGGIDIKKAFATVSSTHAPLLLWDFQTAKRVYQRPVIGARSVMVVSSDRTAFIVNRAGLGPTELTMEAPISAPVGQYGETAYVADSDGVIYAVDLPRRVVLWRFTANSPVTTMPQATDTDLFVVADRTGLIRLDRENGSAAWQNTEATRFLAANPKFVYATDRNGRLLVLDRRRGLRLASLDLSDFKFRPQNETTDRVLLAAHDGTVVSLNDKAYAQPLALQSEGAKIAVPVTEPAKPQPKPEKPLPGKLADKTDKPASPMPTTPPKPDAPKDQ